jgi:trehalose 6-phosphate phosphatase
MRGKTAEDMQRHRPPADLLRDASLFLDFDGTLVEIASTPQAVQVDDQVRGLLTSLSDALGGRLAILSGRSVAEIHAFLPLGLTVAGSHGSEIHDGGKALKQTVRPPSLDAAVGRLKTLEVRRPGVLIEEKPFGLAVHYRQAPDAAEECEALVLEAAEQTGLAVQRGKMVLELKLGGADKGTALRTIMAWQPFAGTVPIMMGDDLTDEPAFAAAREMGGAGVLVGEERESSAVYRLQSVSEALAWLSDVEATLR